MRPTLSQLAGCRRLCNGDSRYARVFEWEGKAVKVYRPVEYEGGGCSNPKQILGNTIEGCHRLEMAGVPVLPILDSWMDGNVAFVVQPMAEAVQWDTKLWKQGKELALAAYVVGVADVISNDVMLYDGHLVIVDTEEIFDADWDDCYGIDLAESWGGF